MDTPIDYEQYALFETYGMVGDVYETYEANTIADAKSHYDEIMTRNPAWAGIDGHIYEADEPLIDVRLYYYEAVD